MPFSIYAQNNEFAVSTGTNVNSSPGSSDFDDPPSSSIDLVITTRDGDTEPRLFEPGDRYDLSYDGPGGAHTLTDAQVIRSDAAPGGGGVIVFEGLNESGELTQIVWTPDFDLDTWYSSNFSGGQPPKFYTTDQDASYSHGYVCFERSVRISAASGPVAAGDLRRGDRVHTLDGGLQPVRWAQSRVVSGYGAGTPILFQPGAIGNSAPLRLSPQHRVLVRSPMAELMFGTGEVLAPAKALVNGADIRRDPCARIAYVHLLLPRHHLLWAEGALCESLFPGDVARAAAGLPGWVRPRAYVPARPILSFSEALVLGRALAAMPPRKRARAAPTAMEMPEDLG